MDEVEKLAQRIKTDAVGVFVEKAASAFFELEAAIGELPENVVNQWKAQLKSITAAILKIG